MAAQNGPAAPSHQQSCHQVSCLLCSSLRSILHAGSHADCHGAVHLCMVWNVQMKPKLQIRLTRLGMQWLVSALRGHTLLGKQRWIISVPSVKGCTESINTAGTEQTDGDITEQDWFSIYILMCTLVAICLRWCGMCLYTL